MVSDLGRPTCPPSCGNHGTPRVFLDHARQSRSCPRNAVRRGLRITPLHQPLALPTRWPGLRIVPDRSNRSHRASRFEGVGSPLNAGRIAAAKQPAKQADTALHR